MKLHNIALDKHQQDVIAAVSITEAKKTQIKDTGPVAVYGHHTPQDAEFASGQMNILKHTDPDLYDKITKMR